MLLNVVIGMLVIFLNYYSRDKKNIRIKFYLDGL